MSKYNITIIEIDLSKNTHSAKGTLLRNGEEVQFNAETIWWEGTRRWKVVEGDRLAVSLENSTFSRGERMGIAHWLVEVSKNLELVGKSSGQGAGHSGGSKMSTSNSSHVQELEAQNKALQEQMSQLQLLMTQLLEEKASKSKKK